MTTPHRVLVLGLGNDMMTDDAVGLHVANEVRRRLAGHRSIEVRTALEMGLALLDQITGFEHLILVDSIQTGSARPGHVHELKPTGFAGRITRSPHSLGIEHVCAVGRSLGLEVPRHIRIVAIEVEDPFAMGTEMTPGVERAVEKAVDRVVDLALKHAPASHATVGVPSISS